MTNRELFDHVLKANMATEAKHELLDLIYKFRKEPDETGKPRKYKRRSRLVNGPPEISGGREEGA
jgi:hypothetical protein